MTEFNPYASPAATTAVSPPELNSSLAGITDFKQLKKLYHRSCNINAIAFLVGLGLVFILPAMLLPLTAAQTPPGSESMMAILLAVMGFYLLTFIGLFLRTSWGRVLGIIACLVSLLTLPVGTIIGAVGLFAFFGAPQLFGTDRITHAQLKGEFKAQKAEQKRQRRIAAGKIAPTELNPSPGITDR